MNNLTTFYLVTLQQYLNDFSFVRLAERWMPVWCMVFVVVSEGRNTQN